MDISKGLARLSKLREKKAAILDPSKRVSTGGVKSGLTELERLKRAKEKIRRDFVTEVVEKKNEALNEQVEDYPRIIDNIETTQRGIDQATEVFASYREKKAYFEAQLILLEKKMEAANYDIDGLNDALDNFEAFNLAVVAYAKSCIEDNEMFEIEEVVTLWENMVRDQDIAILSRGTTTFDSLDYIFNITKDAFKEKTEEAQSILDERIARLFERYAIGQPDEAPSEDI